jgi:hypothetical protein
MNHGWVLATKEHFWVSSLFFIFAKINSPTLILLYSLFYVLKALK